MECSKKGWQAVKTEDSQRVKKIGAGEKIEVIEKILYGIWLVMLGIVLVICSLERSPVLIDGTVRTLCFGLLGMIVLLRALLLLCGSFSSHSRMEDAEFSGRMKDFPGGEKGILQPPFDIHGGLLQFALFALAAILYWFYCFRLDEMISTNSTMDALVAGGLFCAAAVAAEKCSVRHAKEAV